MKVKDILAKADPKSADKSNDFRLSPKFSHVIGNLVFYVVNSQSSLQRYIVTIKLLDLTSNPLRSLKSAMNGDLKVDCVCKGFLYWGWKYIAYKKQYGLNREIRKPTRNNVQEVGTACFSSDTLVWTENGLVPIGNLSVGDLVYTGKGRLKPVVSINTYNVLENNRVMKFNGEEFKVTCDHPILTSDSRYKKVEYRAVDDVKSSYKVLSPKTQFGNIHINSTLAFLSGLFLCNGSFIIKDADSSYPVFENKGICGISIACNAKDKDAYKKKLSSLDPSILTLFHYRNEHGNESVFDLYGPELVSFILSNFGPNSKYCDKHIDSSIVSSWDEESLKQLLLGFFWADGTLGCEGVCKGNNTLCATWCNTNYNLIYNLHVIARHWFCTSGVYSYDRENVYSGKKEEAKELKSSTMYSFRITEGSIEELLSWDPLLSNIKGDLNKNRNVSKFTVYSDDEYFYRSAPKVSNLEGEMQVTSIEVSDDHSYLVGRNGIIVKNCKHILAALKQFSKDYNVIYNAYKKSFSEESTEDSED